MFFLRKPLRAFFDYHVFRQGCFRLTFAVYKKTT